MQGLSQKDSKITYYIYKNRRDDYIYKHLLNCAQKIYNKNLKINVDCKLKYIWMAIVYGFVHRKKSQSTILLVLNNNYVFGLLVSVINLTFIK